MKKHADHIHFTNRLKERFKTDVSLVEEVEMNDLCRTGIYSRCRLSRTRVLNKIPFKGEDFWVIYSSATHNIVTVLTEEMALDIIEREKLFV